MTTLRSSSRTAGSSLQADSTSLPSTSVGTLTPEISAIVGLSASMGPKSSNSMVPASPRRAETPLSTLNLPPGATNVAVAGGFADTLLVQKDGESGSPADQQMLQAAIMQLAPRGRLASCSATSCCWRWASMQLLEEYSTSREALRGLRAIIDEELGASVRQQLLTLRTEHEMVRSKLMEATMELEQVRSQAEVLQQERDDAIAACQKTASALAEVEDTLSEEQTRASDREKGLEAQLAAFSSSNIDQLKEILKSEQERSATLDMRVWKANQELSSFRIRNVDQEAELKQLKTSLAKVKGSLGRLRTKHKFKKSLAAAGSATGSMINLPTSGQVSPQPSCPNLHKGPVSPGPSPVKDPKKPMKEAASVGNEVKKVADTVNVDSEANETTEVLELPAEPQKFELPAAKRLTKKHNNKVFGTTLEAIGPKRQGSKTKPSTKEKEEVTNPL